MSFKIVYGKQPTKYGYKLVQRDRSPELKKDRFGNRFKMVQNDGVSMPVMVVKAGELKPIRK